MSQHSAQSSQSRITRIDLLRHGEPVGGQRYRGKIDDPLSERGWVQMWDAVENLGPWQRILTSPLLRCSEFAHALGKERNIPVQPDSRLEEAGFGVWEGRTPQELRDEDPHQLRRFYHDPAGERPPGAEPLGAFTGRVQQVLDEILSGPLGASVLVVTHAGVMRIAVARILHAPQKTVYRMSIPNAGVIQMQLDEERPPTLMFPSHRLS